jgi:hypothetical protein
VLKVCLVLFSDMFCAVKKQGRRLLPKNTKAEKERRRLNVREIKLCDPGLFEEKVS